MPFSHTSQPRPHAPSVGFSQSSSTKRTSFLLEIEAERLERAEVEIEDVRRRRLQHDLVLVVVLQPVGILAVAAVLRAARRLHVRGAPRLRAERAQERRRVRRAGADLHVVGLQQRAALARPSSPGGSRMICWKVSIEGSERDRRSGHFTGMRERSTERPIAAAMRFIDRPSPPPSRGDAEAATAQSRPAAHRRTRTYGVTPCRPVISTLEDAAREPRQARDLATVVRRSPT